MAVFLLLLALYLISQRLRRREGESNSSFVYIYSLRIAKVESVLCCIERYEQNITICSIGFHFIKLQ